MHSSVSWLGSRAGRATLLEALPAKDRSSLRRLEGNRGLFPAMGASRACLHLLIAVCRSGRAYSVGALQLARLAAFRFVLELFVVEEKLFASSEEKFRAAVDAL